MIPLTILARMRTFALDQLLALVRQGRGVCLWCGSDQPAERGAIKTACDHCGEPQVYAAEEIIVANYRREP